MIEPVLPDKTYFSMGDVSRILQVEPHVLRYWEKKVGLLRPARRESGQRKFTRDDVLLIARIKHLIENKGFTLEGARRFLLDERRRQKDPKVREENEKLGRQTELLKQIERELQDIAECLKD